MSCKANRQTPAAIFCVCGVVFSYKMKSSNSATDEEVESLLSSIQSEIEDERLQYNVLEHLEDFLRLFQFNEQLSQRLQTVQSELTLLVGRLQPSMVFSSLARPEVAQMKPKRLLPKRTATVC